MSTTARTALSSRPRFTKKSVVPLTTALLARLANPRPSTAHQLRNRYPKSPFSLLVSFSSSVSSFTMSDGDASYYSFLEKANQDTGVAPLNSDPKSAAQPPNAKSYSTSSVIPSALKGISATYVSDTDSAFEPVIFDYDGAQLSSAEEFEKLVAKASGNNGPARAEELGVEEWDPRGEYGDVVRRVKEVVEGGDVKVYRVARGKTRAEYFVVGLGSGKVLGVRAEAVES